MMTNVMVKACLNQEIIKIANLIQVKENSAMFEIVTYAKAEFVRIPNAPKCGLNTRHDNREVTVTHLTQGQTLRSGK